MVLCGIIFDGRAKGVYINTYSLVYQGGKVLVMACAWQADRQVGGGRSIGSTAGWSEFDRSTTAMVPARTWVSQCMNGYVKGGEVSYCSGGTFSFFWVRNVLYLCVVKMVDRGGGRCGEPVDRWMPPWPVLCESRPTRIKVGSSACMYLWLLRV